jgi:antitoxin VapB
MGGHYTARSFKSGDDVAILLPVALEVEPDLDWTVIKENGKIIIEAQTLEKPKRKFNIAKVAGCAKELKYIEPKLRVFEPRPSELDLAKSSL